MQWSLKSKEDSLCYLLHIAQTFSVQKDQCVVLLGGMVHTQHPNALGFRPDCGAQRENCTERKECNIQ